jgi:hypothetical protein
MQALRLNNLNMFRSYSQIIHENARKVMKLGHDDIPSTFTLIKYDI